MHSPKSRSPELYLVRQAAPTTTEQNESPHIDGIQRGEASAQEAIYRMYARDIRRVLYRIMGNDDEIVDLHQEVFVHAFRGGSKFRRESSLKTWLIRIAVNRARKLIRRRSRRRWLLFMPVEEIPPAVIESPDDDEVLEARATYEILQRLTADEQIVFALHYVDGMTLDETASAMGCSAGTIKRRISRARGRFIAMARHHAALADYADDGGAP